MFKASHKEAQDRLRDFLPQAGSHYAKMRNYDLSPEDRSNVSLLSPYLRHRVVSESEVVRSVLEVHSFSSADKFIQEVLWRTYWKGWLEMRPQVWLDYLEEVEAQSRGLSPQNQSAFTQATEGRTGIECFDAWVGELKDIGYLHNHSRMWFASIWIFTLKLPWSLGADFFLQHLLDGDPASNTLSWRWVAGLQTKGKNYMARVDNIKKYTEGRFQPTNLIEQAEPLEETVEYSREDLLDLPDETRINSEGPIVVFADDLDVLSHGIQDFLLVTPDCYEQNYSKKVLDFKNALLLDFKDRAQAQGARVTIANSFDDLEKALNGKSNIQCFKPGVGYSEVFYFKLQHGYAVQSFRKSWDSRFYPEATAGFFKFKKQIPQHLQSDP